MRVVGICIAASVMSPAAAQQQPPFIAGTNLVVVPVAVVDRKGGSVRDLTVGDFRIAEDGKPMDIELFTAPAAAGAAAEGRFIVLVLDNLRTPPELAFRVRSIAMRFVERMGPADTMTVIPISRGAATTTSDKTRLKTAIDAFKPAFGESIRSMAEDAEHSLRTIGELSRQMSQARQRRKVMVVIGDAATFNPQRESAFGDRGPDLSQEWPDAIRETARHNISVYVVDPTGLSPDNFYGDFATSFAAETGGWAWANTNNFGAAVEQIWQEAGTYYVLGYNAPVNDTRWHRIDVKVVRQGATVRARRGRY
jgi:VWFA-related protein